MTEKRDGESSAELAGAYALDALSDAERADFQAYLSTSVAARAEAAELSDTAVALGLAVASVTPSAALRTNLIAMIASSPQLAPLSGTPVVPTAGNAHTSAPTAPVDDLVVPVTTAGSGAASERAQQRWFRRPAQLLLAAAAAVVLFVGGTFAGQAVNNNQFVEQQAAGMVEITAASDTERAVTTTADGHNATLVWSNALGLSAVLLDDLPNLGSDKDYQLWYINAAGAASAGTFDSTGSGTSWRVLDGAMHKGDTVGITVEPRGGSAQPTTAPIVAFQST